ncbi:helix-turn-helix domain-containing protein [Actinoplanes sp. DH11]|uniref:helix-turn-helix domain-containing protein n=1 Tax=Actinoplanes sp. DH11 TaxID=2857011 RepID=UPI001E5E1364|nr:helix-turn-helix domain-containing protein [Actinoplanes sp. DH11]
MKDLVVRLAALDANASAAVQVIAYFDGLVEAGAGLPSIVRGAAVLAGCPARLDDDGRRVHIRMLPDGVPAPAPGAADPSWPQAGAGTAELRLERTGGPGPVDAMVLERAASAARAVLDRTRGRGPAAADDALMELLVDADAPVDARSRAGRQLGLVTAYATVLASGEIRVHPTGPAPPAGRTPSGAGTPPAGRAGIGPDVPVLELPVSYAAARTALRFTAAGTDDDPGERVVRHDELGALAVLAEVPEPGAVPDVRRLEQAAAAAPWLLRTVHAVAGTNSLRAAATALRLHHSSLQDRVAHAEHLLGWSLHEPHGRLRVQLALTLRRLHRNPRPDQRAS